MAIIATTSIAPGTDSPGTGGPSSTLSATLVRKRMSRVWVSRACCTMFSVVLLFGGFVFYSLYHDFPIQYHPDESNKAAQILSPDADRNFNHPLLLLETTQLATRWLATPREPQATVEVGRQVSAALTAIAVTALALTGYLSSGWWGFIFVGALTGLCPFLIAHSRYMKEDAALICGLALVMLSSRFLWETRKKSSRWIAAVLLGAACAVAMSGKYIGIVSLTLALPTLSFAPAASISRSRITRFFCVVLFVIAGITTLVAINYRVLENFGRFRDALSREIDHSLTEHRGIYMTTPTTYFLDIAVAQSPALVLVLAALFWMHLLMWRHRSHWDYFLLLFVLIVASVMCFCAIAVSRYALPIVVLTFFLAGLSAAYTVQLLPEKRRARVVGGFAVLATILTVLLPVAIDCTRQFRDDSRQQLRQWVLKNVPHGSTVIEDWYASLTTAPYGTPPDGLQSAVNVRVQSFAPDVVSLDELLRERRPDVYVAVCQISYERWMHPYGIPIPEMKDRYAYYRQWYNELFRSDAFELVWESRQNWDMQSLTNPKIKVYRVRITGKGNGNG